MHSFWRSFALSRSAWISHLAAIGILAAFASVAAFPLVIEPDGVLVGPQFDGRNDLTAQFLAFRSLPRQTLERDGQIPLWNPYLLGGTPWLGNPQSGMFYPPNWILLCTGADWLAGWLMVGHLWWGGLGAYWLVRRLGWNWPAAVLGGSAYLAAPYLIAQTGEGHFNQICLAGWLPWAFLAFEFFRNNVKRGIPWLSAVLAVCFFCGHVQEVYYLALFLTGLFVFEVLTPRTAAKRKALLVGWLGVGALTVGSVAVELLPQFLASKQAVRSGGLSLEQAAAISLNAESFRQLLNPFALGGPENYKGPGSFFWETFFHFGWTVSGLAVLGLLTNLRNPAAWRYVFVGTAAGLIAFGESTPVFGWLFHTVPGFSLFRAPARGLFFVSLAAAVLAAAGVHWITQSKSRRIAGGALILALALMVGETVFRARRILAIVPAENVRDESPIAEFLQKHAGQSRVLVHQDLLSDREAWSAGIIKVHGYDPVPLTRTAVLFDALSPDRSPSQEIVGLHPAFPQRYNPGTLDLLGVKFAVVPGNIPLPKSGWKKARAGQVLRDVTLNRQSAEMLDYVILERENVFPRAFVLGKAKILDANIKLSEQLQTLSPREELLVHQDLLPEGSRQEFQPATITSYSPNRLVVEAKLEHPGYLVVTEAYAAGWSARVNGNRVPVVPANVAFRGIPLAAGRHQVELTYQPPGLKIGLIITGLAVLLLFAIARRDTPEPVAPSGDDAGN